MRSERICKNCDNAHFPEGSKAGQCRALSPVVLFVPVDHGLSGIQANVETHWPCILESEWCAQFKVMR